MYLWQLLNPLIPPWNLKMWLLDMIFSDESSVMMCVGSPCMLYFVFCILYDDEHGKPWYIVYLISDIVWGCSRKPLYVIYCISNIEDVRGSPASRTLSTLARLQLFWLLTSAASSQPDMLAKYWTHIISQANLPNVDEIKVASLTAYSLWKVQI